MNFQLTLTRIFESNNTNFRTTVRSKFQKTHSSITLKMNFSISKTTPHYNFIKELLYSGFIIDNDKIYLNFTYVAQTAHLCEHF